MTPTFRTNAKPLDHIAGLQPMTADDLAFARRNAANDDNPRRDARIVAAILITFVITALAFCWLAHGAFKP